MHTSYHAKIQFLHNHIVEIPRSIFFFDKAQDSCVRVVSQVFMNQLSRSSCSIDNPYPISYLKSCCILCTICGTLPLTDLLQELPAEYSTESALADLTVSFQSYIFWWENYVFGIAFGTKNFKLFYLAPSWNFLP